MIVGGGAAGLATALFAARRAPLCRIALLDGAKKLGAKILVSGGGRCNVTNRVVEAADYWGGRRPIIRRVLAELPVERAIAFFREIGVNLHEENDGKLFPDSNSARTVVDALLNDASNRGIALWTDHRVGRIEREAGGFVIEHSRGQLTAPRVVLATGGLSLPKTGSDGSGYALARALGHTLVPTTPALVPLMLDGRFHAALSGTSQEVCIEVRTDGDKPARLRGSMLWTHFGISGPVALNASRLWHRAKLEARSVTLTANLLPDDDLASADRRLTALAGSHATTHLHNALATLVPARVADALLAEIGIDGRVPMAHLRREDRRRLLHALLAWPLPVRDSRGFGVAEVTAGGVPLDEVHSNSMESRCCPGLHLVGEILDVDGRIGGFNFQWAWASAFVAARGITRA